MAAACAPIHIQLRRHRCPRGTPEPIVLDERTFFRYTPSMMLALLSAVPHERTQVCFKRRYFERSATDRGVHDTGLSVRYRT